MMITDEVLKPDPNIESRRWPLDPNKADISLRIVMCFILWRWN
jgi:hypothetical protein